jgi:hypothetical protein
MLRPKDKIVRKHERKCRVCGKIFFSRRFDAFMCSALCRKNLGTKRDGRPGDLAYLKAECRDPIIANARKYVLDANKSDIETRKAHLKQRRIWRAAARNAKRPLHLKPLPDPAPDKPPKRRGGGNFITV